MVASSIIQYELPTIKLTDSCQKAIDLFAEYKIEHIAVVQNKVFQGIVSESILYEHEAGIVEDCKMAIAKVFVQDDTHIYDILKLVSDYKLTLVPVLNNKQLYLGSISIKALLTSFNELAAVKNVGGIIILELNANDYSMAEIARIIEANGAKIMSAYVTPHNNSTKIDVTLKLNKPDLDRIIRAFTRFDYTIKETYHESEFTDELKDRYDNFMHYLNI